MERCLPDWWGWTVAANLCFTTANTRKVKNNIILNFPHCCLFHIDQTVNGDNDGGCLTVLLTSDEIITVLWQHTERREWQTVVGLNRKKKLDSMGVWSGYNYDSDFCIIVRITVPTQRSLSWGEWSPDLYKLSQSACACVIFRSKTLYQSTSWMSDNRWWIQKYFFISPLNM